MPGTGKTTFGMQLAQHLECVFFDLDYEIEREEGKTASQIFGSFGEPHFRELEKKKLTQFIQNEQKSFVLATGGGTPCFYNNLQLMMDSGEVIHVYTDIPSLAKRLKRKIGSRPLLKGKNVLDALNTIWSARREFYEMAHHEYDAKNQSIPDFLEIMQSEKGSK